MLSGLEGLPTRALGEALLELVDPLGEAGELALEGDDPPVAFDVDRVLLPLSAFDS